MVIHLINVFVAMLTINVIHLQKRFLKEEQFIVHIIGFSVCIVKVHSKSSNSKQGWSKIQVYLL